MAVSELLLMTSYNTRYALQWNSQRVATNQLSVAMLVRLPETVSMGNHGKPPGVCCVGLFRTLHILAFYFIAHDRGRGTLSENIRYLVCML